MSKQRGRGQGSLFKRSGRSAWIASWYGYDGRRREKSTRTSDRRAADRILAKCVADAALRREGVIDPKLESIAQESRKPLAWHLDGFEAKMNAAGRKSKHVATTIGYVKRIADAVGWVQISDVSAAGITKLAESLKEQNRSARTI
ncbi:MAG: hypothetical protein ACE5E5_07005 [Phycisphaerae bacterium]